MLAMTLSRGASSDDGVARRPPRTKKTASAATPKLAASTTNAGPVWTRAMAAPAAAGPMSPITCVEPCIRALAGDSSRSGTIIGTMVPSAG